MRSRLPDRCGPVGARARPTNHRSGSPSAGHYSSQAESPHQPRIALARHQAAGCRGRFIIPAFIGKARAIGIKTVLTAVRAPQANAIAERVVGTLRRECLDHLIIVNERHLRLVLREYVAHYNHVRPHQALELWAPDDRRPRSPPRSEGQVVGRPILGGLHHEYECLAA